jgi:hypothetical protein
MLLLLLLTDLFHVWQQYDSKASSAACRRAGRLSRAVKDDWQSVPDDVLQAMVAYLSPADVAVARRVCRHWRCMLSCYTTALTLPTRYGTRRTCMSAAFLFARYKCREVPQDRLLTGLEHTHRHHNMQLRKLLFM